MDNGSNLCKNSTVEVKESDGVATMYIIGDFDSSTTHLVHKCCDKISNKKSITKIVLDLEKAGRVDTSAFACVINFIREHNASEAEIFVAHLHDPDEKLIQILKVQKLIKTLQ